MDLDAKKQLQVQKWTVLALPEVCALLSAILVAACVEPR